MVRFRLLGTLAICGCIVAFALQLPGEKTYFIPFDEAQVQDQYSPKDLINFYQRLKKKKWRLVRHLYTSSLAGRKKRQKHTRIPKIIHQIWLEGPIPAEIRSIQASWTKLHPDWEYHLWTKEEVAFLYLQNRGYYDETDSLKIKSEILRYEILFQFGGVFVENNIACVRSFDILTENLDFFAGLTDQIRSPRISAALIGSIPSHPVMRDCLRNLRISRPKHPGSSLLTQSFLKVVKKRDPLDSVALPATFLNPFPKDSEESHEETSLYKTTFAVRNWEASIE